MGALLCYTIYRLTLMGLVQYQNWGNAPSPHTHTHAIYLTVYVCVCVYGSCMQYVITLL